MQLVSNLALIEANGLQIAKENGIELFLEAIEVYSLKLQRIDDISMESNYISIICDALRALGRIIRNDDILNKLIELDGINKIMKHVLTPRECCDEPIIIGAFIDFCINLVNVSKKGLDIVISNEWRFITTLVKILTV